MAVTNTARGWYTIVDLNDGRTLNFGISANSATTQIHNPDTGAYVKDFTTNNLVLTPFLYITGESNNMISLVTPDGGTAATNGWTINGSKTLTSWGSASSSSPYALTIDKNLTGNTTQLQCVFSGTFTDPDTGLTTKVKAEKTISRLDSAGSTYFLVLTYPGSTYFYNSTVQNIQITGTLYHGTTEVSSNVTWEWYKYSSGGWSKITTGSNSTITGYTTNTITVYPDFVDDMEQFKCIATESGGGSAQAISEVIKDLSDPYDVYIYCASGNILTQGATQCTLEAQLMKGGQILDPNDPTYAALYSSVTWEWTKADKQGTPVTTGWGTNGKKTTQSITVTRSEIDVKATFFVKATFGS